MTEFTLEPIPDHCPFCGSADQIGVDHPYLGVYQVHCHVCHAKGPVQSLHRNAIFLWNKRTRHAKKNGRQPS